MLGNPFNIKKLNEIGSFFIFKLGLIVRFLSISRRDFVSNSGLLVESTTQIGAEIVLLNGAAYPEFRLTILLTHAFSYFFEPLSNLV